MKIGFRIPVDRTVCRDVEECRKVNPMMEPGVVYEVRVRLSTRVPWADPSNLDKLYAVIQKVRRAYPGVVINYIEIDDSGKNVVIQMFDPIVEGELIGPLAILAIVVIILLLPITFMVGMAIYYRMTGHQLPPPWPKWPSPPKAPSFPSWGIDAILASIGIVSVAYLLKQMDIKDIVRRLTRRGA